jgi:hypothetical protein
MNILDIDAASFAGRVAHVAASELHGLVSRGRPGGIINWYDRGGSELPPEQINLDIDAAADYVTTKHCSGEQLWHKMLLERRAAPNRKDQTAFADLPFSVQLAYNIFAQVCDLAHSRIQAEQNRAENDLDLATQPEVRLKLEDSIFEPEEDMGTLRPEAVIASGLDAVRRDLEARDALLVQDQTEIAAITGLDKLNDPVADLSSQLRSELADAFFPSSEMITIGEREYRKFIRYPEEVDDGTLRCIACGQIDEEEYHDQALCPACNEGSRDAQELAANFSSAGAPDPAGEAGAAGAAAGEDGGSVGNIADASCEGAGAPGASSASTNAPPAAAPGGEAAALSIGAKPHTPAAGPVGFDPLKIGDAPPAPKPNRGGRGKKKQKSA